MSEFQEQKITQELKINPEIPSEAGVDLNESENKNPKDELSGEVEINLNDQGGEAQVNPEIPSEIGIDLNENEEVAEQGIPNDKPLNPEGIDLNEHKKEEESELNEEDLAKEKIKKAILNYIEASKKNSKESWQADFELAKQLAEEGELESALKLALMAREAQIKEGFQKETPTEKQL